MSFTNDPTSPLLDMQKPDQSESNDLSKSEDQSESENKKVIDNIITSEAKHNDSERVPNIPIRMTTRLASKPLKPKSTPVSRLTLITRLNPPK